MSREVFWDDEGGGGSAIGAGIGEKNSVSELVSNLWPAVYHAPLLLGFGARQGAHLCALRNSKQ
eukprot:scaffold17114_cov21-Tisochrysis_lutea.AAC.1